MESEAVTDPKHKRILVVDDEPGILSSLSQVLSSAYKQYSVGTASSAEQAIDWLKKNEVDLLITDLKLPEMDGLTLARSTYESCPHTRSILMTAFGTAAIHSDAYRYGCVAYLEKPFDIDSLLKSIDQTFAVEDEPDPIAATLGVAEVLQSSALRKKGTVSLHIAQGSSSGMLFMEDGIVQFAEFDGLLGPAALVAILGCKTPSVSVVAATPRFNRRGLSIPWQAVVAASRAPSLAEQFRMLKMKFEFDDPGPSTDMRDVLRMHPLKAGFNTPAPLLYTEPGPAEPLQAAFYRAKPMEILLRHSLGSLNERSERLRGLINAGVEHFQADELEKAKRCWLAALRIDPECKQAKRNIAVIRKLLVRKGLLD